MTLQIVGVSNLRRRSRVSEVIVSAVMGAKLQHIALKEKAISFAAKEFLYCAGLDHDSLTIETVSLIVSTSPVG